MRKPLSYGSTEVIFGTAAIWLAVLKLQAGSDRMFAIGLAFGTGLYVVVRGMESVRKPSCAPFGVSQANSFHSEVPLDPYCPADIRFVTPTLLFAIEPYRLWLKRIDCLDENTDGVLDWIERVNTALFHQFDQRFGEDFAPEPS